MACLVSEQPPSVLESGNNTAMLISNDVTPFTAARLMDVLMDSGQEHMLQGSAAYEPEQHAASRHANSGVDNADLV